MGIGTPRAPDRGRSKRYRARKYLPSSLPYLPAVTTVQWFEHIYHSAGNQLHKCQPRLASDSFHAKWCTHTTSSSMNRASREAGLVSEKKKVCLHESVAAAATGSERRNKTNMPLLSTSQFLLRGRMGAAIWAIVSQRSARGQYRMSDATSTGGEGNTALCRMFDLSHTPANWGDR